MSSRSSRWCTVLTEATVPTGMKIGVCMVPWSVEMVPARALPVVVLLISKNKDIILSCKRRYVLVFFYIFIDIIFCCRIFGNDYFLCIVQDFF